MVVCLKLGANLHMAQLMPLPLTVSRFSKIQIGFTFLVLAYPGSPGKGAVKRVCVCRFPVPGGIPGNVSNVHRSVTAHQEVTVSLLGAEYE